VGLCLGVSLLLLGCQAPSPVAPEAARVPSAPAAAGGSLEAGAVLAFVSGESGAPAGNVDVLLDGRLRYRTDAAGQVRLTESTDFPVWIEASSPDYLLRQTALRSVDDRRLSLWPSRSPTGLDEDLTRALVYTDAASRQSVRLRRLQEGDVSVVPSGEFLRDATAMAALRAAVETLTHATGGAVRFRVESTPTSGVVIDTAINAQDPAMGVNAALAYRTLDGNRITGGRLVFRSLDVARLVPVVTHELSHTLGLEHSSNPGDLMYAMIGSEPKELSSRERLVITLMRKRRAGNRFPDDDREEAAGLGRRVQIVACGHAR
jgi:hypothetical protein